MSKAGCCPCCRRKAKRGKAVKRIRAYAEYSRKKDELISKLLELVRTLAGSEGRPFRDLLAKHGLRLAPGVAGSYAREAPGDGDVAAMNRSWSQFFGSAKPLQPVQATPEAPSTSKDGRRAAEERRRQLKRASNRRWYAAHPNYSKEYYQRKKRAAEATRSKGSGNNGH